MTLVFTIQGFFKHLLTEADRIVLAAVSDNYNQGVYAMGSSYGGMAARILLQPLEENARLLWSRQASRKDSSKDLEQSYTVLVKLVLYIGLIFSCIAVNYTNLVLNILAGRKWGSNAEAAGVLSAFCVYTAFLACNGMTEAFVYGVTTSGVEVGRLGMAHTLIGVVFALSAPSLVSSYGTVGLVGANCVAMSMRSIYSLHFASRYFGERESTSPSLALRRLLRKLSPHPVVLGCFVLAWVSTRWTLSRLQETDLHTRLDFQDKEWLFLTGQHLAAGVSCVVGIASVAIAMEVAFIRSLRSMVRAKQD
jgi:oligosaccharide translocation protein RFT1